VLDGFTSVETAFNNFQLTNVSAKGRYKNKVSHKEMAGDISSLASMCQERWILLKHFSEGCTRK